MSDFAPTPHLEFVGAVCRVGLSVDEVKPGVGVAERAPIRDRQDLRLKGCPTMTINDRMPAEVESQVAKRAAANVCGRG